MQSGYETARRCAPQAHCRCVQARQRTRLPHGGRRELSAMMSKRPGIKMADTHRRIASVVAASQKDEEDAEMQATAETVPLRCALARQRTATSANRPASVQLTSVLLLHQWHQPALSDAA